MAPSTVPGLLSAPQTTVNTTGFRMRADLVREVQKDAGALRHCDKHRRWRTPAPHRKRQGARHLTLLDVRSWALADSLPPGRLKPTYFTPHGGSSDREAFFWFSRRNTAPQARRRFRHHRLEQTDVLDGEFVWILLPPRQ